MNTDMTREQILATIVTKSDQFNYDDLTGGPITVTVAGVSAGAPDQPVNIRLVGEKRFYRPGKSMRRVLIMLWGDDGHKWVGRSMTLYGDPNIKFGGVAVGGIRISHMTDIDVPKELFLTMTRGKKAPYEVRPLHVEAETNAESTINAEYILAAAEKAAQLGYVELEKYGKALSSEGQELIRPEWKRLKAIATEADLKETGNA